MSYDKYLEHIDTTMGADTPIAFGLHPNAEIDFRTQQSDTMFKVQRQGRDICMSRCRLVGVNVQSQEILVPYNEKLYHPGVKRRFQDKTNGRKHLRMAIAPESAFLQ